MKKEAEVNAESDRKAREEIDKINAADSMIYQTEKQLNDYGDKIPKEKKETIQLAHSKLKDAHKEKNLAAIETALTELNTAWQAASEEMYKATQEQKPPTEPHAGTGTNGSAKTNGKDEATDVDFEEVKAKDDKKKE